MKKIIEKLSSKELSFGCEVTFGTDVVKKLLQKDEEGWWCCLLPNKLIVRCKEESFAKVLGHPVYIGDVLERARNIDEENVIIFYWKPCGLSNSLQTIAEESGYEEFCQRADCEDNPNCKEEQIQRLKSPQARALEEFLTSIL